MNTPESSEVIVARYLRSVAAQLDDGTYALQPGPNWVTVEREAAGIGATFRVRFDLTLNATPTAVINRISPRIFPLNFPGAAIK